MARKTAQTAGAQVALTDNFQFQLIGQDTAPFAGYVSSNDPTRSAPNVLIAPSQNVYKKSNGNIANRPGLKRRGSADATQAGGKSSFEWQNAGDTRPLRACNGKLQVEFDPGTGNQWYDILTGLTTDEMLFSFVSWYDTNNSRDLLLFVNGEHAINMWQGGVAVIASAANTTGIIRRSDAMNYVLASPAHISAGGIGYTVGDVLTITGGNNDAQIRVTSVGAATSVATVSVTAGGNNYSIGDIVRTGGGSIAAGDAVFMVTGVSGTAVTALSIMANGLGLSTGAGQATHNILSTLAGAGLTISIDSVGSSISGFQYVNNGSGYITSVSGSGGSTTTGGTGTGATVDIFSIATGRMTVSGTVTALQLGFAGANSPTSITTTETGGSVLVSGVTYTYNNIGDDGYSFIGVSPDPTPTVGGVATAVVVVTNTAATSTDAGGLAALEDIFTNDAIAVVGNQVHLICYTSRIIHVSSILHYDHYDLALLAAGTLRTPGFPDIIILDSNGRAVGAQKGDAVLFGSEGDSYLVHRVAAIYNQDVATVNTAFAYEQVTVSKEQSSDLSSPLGQDFITSIGDSILFLDNNNQLRQYGTLRNIVTPVYPVLSLDVYDELKSVDFTGGHIRAVGEQSTETVYIVSPLTGVTYQYLVRQEVDSVGNLTAERLWHAPFTWGISRVAVINGVSYGHSSSNPQIYQLWDTEQWHDDSPTDESVVYFCRQVMAYRNSGDRTKQVAFDKVFHEGYIGDGTKLYTNAYLDYQGSTDIHSGIINDPEADFPVNVKTYTGTNPQSLGDRSIGDGPLGDDMVSGLNGGIPKYRKIVGYSESFAFEYALELWSEQIDAQWETVCLGANAVLVSMHPDELMD